MPRAATQAASFSPVTEPLRFHFLPLLFAAVCFSCGIAVASFIWLMPSLLFIGLLLCGVLCLPAAHNAHRISLVPLVAVFLLLGAFCAEVAPRPDPQRQLVQLADGAPRTLEGIVTRIGPVHHI